MLDQQLAELNGQYRLPAEAQRRYDALIDKLHDETLSDEEHAELIRMTDEIELLNVERIKALIALARERGVPLNTLLPSRDRPLTDENDSRDAVLGE